MAVWTVAMWETWNLILKMAILFSSTCILKKTWPTFVTVHVIGQLSTTTPFKLLRLVKRDWFSMCSISYLCPELQLNPVGISWHEHHLNTHTLQPMEGQGQDLPQIAAYEWNILYFGLKPKSNWITTLQGNSCKLTFLILHFMFYLMVLNKIPWQSLGLNIYPRPREHKATLKH